MLISFVLDYYLFVIRLLIVLVTFDVMVCVLLYLSLGILDYYVCCLVWFGCGVFVFCLLFVVCVALVVFWLLVICIYCYYVLFPAFGFAYLFCGLLFYCAALCLACGRL